MHHSIPSLTIPWATPGDSYILVAPVVGFSPHLSCPGVCPRGVLNKKKSSIILKKSAIFANKCMIKIIRGGGRGGGWEGVAVKDS